MKEVKVIEIFDKTYFIYYKVNENKKNENVLNYGKWNELLFFKN